MARREDVPVARLQMGKSPHLAVSVYAFTAAELGVPLVEIGGCEHLRHLTIEQAEKLAEGLLLASRIARGEVLPTQLDRFLEGRNA